MDFNGREHIPPADLAHDTSGLIDDRQAPKVSVKEAMHDVVDAGRRRDRWALAPGSLDKV